jgi:hypothetical protein
MLTLLGSPHCLHRDCLHTAADVLVVVSSRAVYHPSVLLDRMHLHYHHHLKLSLESISSNYYYCHLSVVAAAADVGHVLHHSLDLLVAAVACLHALYLVEPLHQQDHSIHWLVLVSLKLLQPCLFRYDNYLYCWK